MATHLFKALPSVRKGACYMREFIFIILILCFIGCKKEPSNPDSSDNYQLYIEEVNATYDKIVKYIEGKDDMRIFSVIADTHFDYGKFDKNIYHAMCYGAYLLKHEAVIHLGDITTGGVHNYRESESILEDFSDHYRRLNSPYYDVCFTYGNHEWEQTPSGKPVTVSQWEAVVCLESSYYVKQYGADKFIFLNTSDVFYYGYSNKQVHFLCQELMSAQGRVVIFQHYSIDDTFRWVSYDSADSYTNMPEVRNCLEKFAAKQPFVFRGTTYKFDDTSGKLVAVISGDSHLEGYVKTNGVNYICQPGYGGQEQAVYPNKVTWPPLKFGNIYYDIYVLSDSEIAGFRVGTGKDKVIKF